MTTHHFLPALLRAGINHTFAADLFHLLVDLVEGCCQDHGRQSAGTEVGIGQKRLQQEMRPGAKGKSVIFVLVVVLPICREMVSILGIFLIEHVVVNHFSPLVGGILVWIDDAGQGSRFEVGRHLKAITRLQKCRLVKRRREGVGWVYLGDREGVVVLEEGVSGQQVSLRR